MSQYVKLVIKGPNEGRTMKLKRWIFRNGELVLQRQMTGIADGIRYLHRCYQVWVAGDQWLNDSELAPYVWRGDDGERDSVEPEAERVPGYELRGDVQSLGDGPEETQPDQPVEPSPDDPEEGDAGVRAEGDGHEDAGLPDEPAPTSDDHEKVKAAVLALDHTSNDHWTAQGLPAIVAVREAAGMNELTRAEVEAAVPEYTRGDAKKRALQDLM